MKRIAIIGAGHLGQQIKYHIHQDTEDRVVAFFDDTKEVGTIENEIEIIGSREAIIKSFEDNLFDELIVAIGYKHMMLRASIYNEFSNKIPFYTFVHSSCYIDISAKIGMGTILYPGCIIDQNVNIGNNVLLNVGCTIAHDSFVNDHCFLSPRVAVAGFVSIGEQCIIGINATIIDNINIAPKVQIGAAGVVIKNINERGLYVGNPIRFVR